MSELLNVYIEKGMVVKTVKKNKNWGIEKKRRVYRDDCIYIHVWTIEGYRAWL